MDRITAEVIRECFFFLNLICLSLYTSVSLPLRGILWDLNADKRLRRVFGGEDLAGMYSIHRLIYERVCGVHGLSSHPDLV